MSDPQPVVQHTPSETAGTAWSQRTARIVLGIGLLLLGLFILEGFLRALAWAAVLAVATWPLYLRVQRRIPPGRHNILLPLLFTVVTTLVVLVPLVTLGVQASHEVSTIARWLSQARQNGVPMPDALQTLPFGQAQVSGWWSKNLAQPDGARAVLGRMDTEVMSFGRNYGSRAVHTVINFFFTMTTLFFLYKDGPDLSRKLLDLSRRLFGPHGERMSRQIVASIHGTVDGLVLVGLGVGAVMFIAYEIAGVPHPALLGLVTAAAAMVPSGAWILLVVAALMLVAAGKTVAAIALGGFGVVVIFGADHFIRPVLIGGATKLPFLWVLLGIVGGVETFGLLGLFLGPATMAALILLWREWVGGATSDAPEPTSNRMA